MKRDRDLDQREELDATLITKPASSSSSSTNSKTWVESQDTPDAGMDELLAVLGYKIKSSDMADVAQKLEQLEMVMNTSSSIEDEFSNIFSDTVHYNPSDLSNWVQSMLSELNNNGLNNSIGEIEPQIFADDLRAIPGDAIFNKKLKSSVEFSGEASRPVVLVDSQESGIRLVHTLMACAEAIQKEDLKLADTLVKHVGLLAVSQSGSMRKVATYFGEALARKIYKIYPQDLESSYSDVLQMHFYETCPYLKFAHFTANQAILEAFAGAERVHVIDFSLNQGTQWPALMQALALRPGGPPKFRLTGIGPPQPDNTDALQQVGWKLAQLAETIGVPFEFRGFVTNSLADLDASILDIRPSDVETVAINSVFELHRLLARPGGIEKVLNSIKSMSPKIVTIVEQEANHNGNVFLDRFNEALHYYSTMFDSLENSGSTQLGNNDNNQDLVMSEMHIGRQICNVVACEGVDRIERHETLTQWRGRMNSAGFERVYLGSNAFKQASMLLALFAGGDGYKVEENEGSLMLGWHTRPLIATSAWQLSGRETQ